MKLVVGLGNPGARYAGTRHNVGFRVVERFAAREGFSPAEPLGAGRLARGLLHSVPVAVLEPLTYMNRSGEAVREAVERLGVADVPNDLVVVFDDVDLPFGRLRIRAGGGSGGHRGLADVIEKLGRRDFPRLRFGVGRPPPGQSTTDYVLEPFTEEEERALDDHLDRAAEAVAAVLSRGLEFSMNRYNAADAEP